MVESMSWKRTITVWCDGCGEVISGGDLNCETVEEGRRFARIDADALTGIAKGGGTVRPNESRDLCGDCKKDPRARAKVGLPWR